MARLTINGQPLEIRMDPDCPLLWGLRDGAGLTGTKYGCGNGDCGACTVNVDGQARLSCTLTLGECEGRMITTIEGLAQNGRLHPVQQAFLDEQAFQCGFCTPGLVMGAAALLQTNADPGEADIKGALTNLCRCGVYPRLIRAVQRAGAAMRAALPPAPAPASAPSPSPAPSPAPNSAKPTTPSPQADATFAPAP